MTNKAFNSALVNDAITLKIIDKTVEFERFKQSKEHRQLKIGLPYFVILNSQGEREWSGTDYQATKTMISVLHRLRN